MIVQRNLELFINETNRRFEDGPVYQQSANNNPAPVPNKITLSNIINKPNESYDQRLYKIEADIETLKLDNGVN